MMMKETLSIMQKLISAYRCVCARLWSLLLAALCGAAAACDGAIYDDQGDCTVTYRVAFRYDMNMKWADAFDAEVESIHLYAFAPDGLLAGHQVATAAELRAAGNTMVLDLAPGDYRIVAWGGLEPREGTGRSFVVPEVTVGETRIEELTCRLERQRDASARAFSREQLNPLFHGMIDAHLPVNDDGGEYNFTMPLTKDTNHVRIILQHLSGQEVNPADFTFRIEEENGLMNYDNSLLTDERITYHPYHTGSGTAGLGIDDYPQPGSHAPAAASCVPGAALCAPAAASCAPASAGSSRAITSVSVAIADLSVARLMAGRPSWLVVETLDGQVVARIPLTDYALLLKDGYGREMSDQEYLDRQDEYALTFFLDESRLWIRTTIIINSWKIVFNDVDFGDK